MSVHLKWWENSVIGSIRSCQLILITSDITHWSGKASDCMPEVQSLLPRCQNDTLTCLFHCLTLFVETLFVMAIYLGKKKKIIL